MLDISALTPLEESRLLKASNVNSLSPYGIIGDLRDDPKYWHRFCITNVDTEGRQILRHIVNFIYPHDLLPVYFIRKDARAYFLARNCTNAIVQFCKSGFVIYNPAKPDKPYNLQILVNIETTDAVKVIDVQKNLVEVLQRRAIDNELDLSNFCDDRDLKEFCPLSQQKIMTYVLHLSERFHPTKINLENNDLRTIDTLEKYADLNITHINLKKNHLQTFGSLKVLKKFKSLTHIWLDQNPFIEKLPDSMAYITVVKDMCNKIQYLDGICISSGIPPPNKTFLCTEDAAHFTNQFLEYYFPLYDEDREKLADLYDPRSCRFSLTYFCNASNKKPFPMLEEPEHFKFRNRNILMDHSDIFLYKEWSVISNIFGMLPKTRHDPSTFFTDVMQYNQESAIVTVTGCFKEFGGVTDRYYSFSRTFMLKCIFRRTHLPEASAVWVITNDQLNVVYPSLIEFSTREVEKKTLREILECPMTKKNYAELEKTFEMLTSLKPEFARAFFEASKYNLKEALESFIELSKRDSISTSAFKDDREQAELIVKPPAKPKPSPAVIPTPVIPISNPLFPNQSPSIQKSSSIKLNLQTKPQVVSPVPPPNVRPANVDAVQSQAKNISIPPHPILNPKGKGQWPRQRQLVALPRSLTNAQNHPLLKNAGTIIKK